MEENERPVDLIAFDVDGTLTPTETHEGSDFPVVVYARVSTEEQGRQGISMEAQVDKCLAYAKVFGMNPIKVYQDVKSGSSMERLGLQKALHAMRQGRAMGVIVYRLDRLTRSVRDLAELLEDHFHNTRFRLISVSESLDTHSAAGRLVVNVIGAVAQWERETIGERTRMAQEHLKARRLVYGTIPFGWRRVEGTKSLELSPGEQVTLQEMWRLHQLGYGTWRMCKYLNTHLERFPSRGDGWTITGIREKVLRLKRHGGDTTAL